MLGACGKFGVSAYNLGLVSNANKSKCLFFCKAGHCTSFKQMPLFRVAHKEIEYVTEWQHPGHTFSTKFKDNDDIL